MNLDILISVIRNLPVLGIAVLLAACRPAAPDAPSGADAAELGLPREIVVALKPDKDPDLMLEERESLAAFLSPRLGRPVRVIVPLAAAVILEGFANGTIDLGYLSATDLVRAADRGLARMLLMGEIDGKTYYQSYWVTLADHPARSVADLRGQPIAFASRSSTSGFVVPLDHLHRQGLLQPGQQPEAFFGQGKVWFGTGYVSAIERVLAGHAAAAAVSDYVIDQDRHLSAEQRARLRVLAAQGPVPTHVIAVRASLPEGTAALLREAILGADDPAAAGLQARLFSGRLIAGDEASHLQPLREALQRLDH